MLKTKEPHNELQILATFLIIAVLVAAITLHSNASSDVKGDAIACTPWCSDSDGYDITTPGTVQTGCIAIQPDLITANAIANIASPATSSKSDFCRPDGITLVEYFCQQDKLAYNETTCTYGCDPVGKCNPIPAICGDGIVQSDKGEDCEIGNTKPCASGSSGTVTCNDCKWDTSACIIIDECGTGVKSASEQCDGNDLGGITECTQWDIEAYSAGTLSCTQNCMFNTSQCVPKVACSNIGATCIYNNECCSNTCVISGNSGNTGYCEPTYTGPTCTDSDNGRDLSVNGTTFGINAIGIYANNLNRYTRTNDFCVVDNRILEGECVYNSYTQRYEYGVFVTDCPNGCSNGKCISDLPDLSVRQIILSDTYTTISPQDVGPIVTTPVFLYVKVYNGGTLRINNSLIRMNITVDELALNSIYTPVCGTSDVWTYPGTTTICTPAPAQLILPQGTHTIVVTLDPYNTITESIETNNVGSSVRNVNFPDLVVQDIKYYYQTAAQIEIIGNELPANTLMNVVAVIKNNGGNIKGYTPITYNYEVRNPGYTSNTVTSNVPYNGLPTGGTITVSVGTLGILPYGVANVTITADSAHTISESVESNNNYSESNRGRLPDFNIQSIKFYNTQTRTEITGPMPANTYVQPTVFIKNIAGQVRLTTTMYNQIMRSNGPNIISGGSCIIGAGSIIKNGDIINCTGISFYTTPTPVPITFNVTANSNYVTAEENFNNNFMTKTTG